MIRYILNQIKIKSSKAFGQWIAKPVVEETVNLDKLAEHMSDHNSPYSKGAIKGILTDMVTCIKELLLGGKNVKIDDLAIFSLGIKNKKGGADSESEFSVAKNVETVKLRARATGDLNAKSLNLDATLKKAVYVNGKLTPGSSTEDASTDSETPSGSGSGDSQTPVTPENPSGGDNGDDDGVIS
jgi:predicted histone-like DNA-binding protein